jgi:hypothetical protein
MQIAKPPVLSIIAATHLLIAHPPAPDVLAVGASNKLDWITEETIAHGCIGGASHIPMTLRKERAEGSLLQILQSMMIETM